MDTIFLHLARGDFGQTEVAEEWQQVQTQTDGIALDPFRRATARGDDLVFLQELVRCLTERLLIFYQPEPVFRAQPEIPVLGEVRRLSEAFLFGRGAMISVLEMGRALSVPAVLALIKVDFATHDSMAEHPAPHIPKMCRTCEGYSDNKNGSRTSLNPLMYWLRG
jgi:hypothetical protein